MLRFTWDPHKSDLNRRKHGVRFEVAARVFADPFALMEQDQIVDGERRWRTIGLVEGTMLLVVAHTVEDSHDGSELIRIISARQAERRERYGYEEEKRRYL
jgi:uncharacterized DUF497 family protein